MPYEFIRLSPELYLIRWYRSPSVAEATQFVDEHLQLLDNALHPLYFISDLRQGYITDTIVIRRLAKLTQHANYGGGTAFGTSNNLASSFVGIFFRFARGVKYEHNIWHTAKEALDYLESLKTGLTANINWDDTLNYV
ncbi:MAG: hypothetical protein H6673_08395 [Anaerolineales bacterium]|nr:hypothetical protein [Anaerolineales bacterium]